jgi:hypothetical protein
MNWEAIGTIAEIVGAAAVVVSLLYVAMQIRQNTRQIRVATHDGTSRDLRQLIREISTAGLTEVFVLGLEDPDSLDDRQKLDFAFLIYDLFKAFENVYYHYLHGTLGEDAWQGWRRFIEQYATAPGARRYWHVRRDIFTTDFRDLIDGMKPAADIKRVGDVFGGKYGSSTGTAQEGPR